MAASNITEEPEATPERSRWSTGRSTASQLGHVDWIRAVGAEVRGVDGRTAVDRRVTSCRGRDPDSGTETKGNAMTKPRAHRTTRTAILAGAVTLSLALAGCSSGGDANESSAAVSSETSAGSAEASAASAPKPEVLHMLYATAEANAEAVQSLESVFEEKFGIDLQIDTQPYEALQQKVFSEFASSSSYYDIVIVDTPWAPALVGKLEPLSAYLMNPALNDVADTNVGDFIPKVFYDTAVYQPADPVKVYPDQEAAPDPAAITAAGFDVFGLPLQANALVMAYRQDMFENADTQAKYKADTGKDLVVPANLDDFASVAKWFTNPDAKMYGATMMAGVGDWATDDFKSLLAAFGGNGRMISQDEAGTSLVLDFDSPEGANALKWYHDLIASGATPPGTTSASWDTVAQSFDSGIAAMTWNYHTLALDDGVDGKIAYAPVPVGPSGAQGPHFGTWMLAVNSFSQNKDWAYRAITWLTASEQQLAMTALGLHPSRVSVYDAIASGDASADTKSFYDTLGQALAVGDGRPRLTNYTEVSQAISVGVNSAATGDQSPEEALASTRDSVTRLLTDAGYTVN